MSNKKDIDMKKAMTILLSELRDFTNHRLDLVSIVLGNVRDDLAKLGTFTQEKAIGLVDSICDDERIYNGVHGFLKAAQDSKVGAVGWLEANWDGLQAYLNEAVMESKKKKRLVAFIDGVVNVFLAVPADRQKTSPIYREYVNYGRAIGAILSVVFFLPGFGIRGLIGFIPYVTHIVTYFNQKTKQQEGSGATE